MMSQSAALVIAGNSSLADNILSKNFKEIAPIFGTKIEGPDKFKSTIDGLFSVSCADCCWKTNTSLPTHLLHAARNLSSVVIIPRSSQNAMDK